MSEKWKGPTAVLGILTILTTIAIFIYQERKPPATDKPKQQSPDKPTISLQNYTKIVNNYESAIDSINKLISLYSGSFEQKVKRIKITTAHIEVLNDILKNDSLPDWARSNKKRELDTLKNVTLPLENADTLRYKIKITRLLKQHKEISDSLRYYKEYNKIE
jgi:hypothetical protein